MRRGNAITAEITNERWNRKLGYKLPVISPELAAERLLISNRHVFTLYEFFLTDHLGHGRIADEFEKIYNDLDRFLLTILNGYDKEKSTMIFCSDHGNFEDLSIKSHTLNPAFTLAAGKYSDKIFKKVKDLTHFKKVIFSILK